MMKDCPLVVYGKKTTNDAKRGGLKLGLASYLPQKWWCQAPENISCQITGYFFPFTISTMTDGLVLLLGENILPSPHFVYVSKSSK